MNSPAPVSVLAAHRRAAAMEIVRVHTGLCVAANLVPVPLVGGFFVAGIQLQMAEALAGHYGVAFDGARSRRILEALGTGAVHVALTGKSTTRVLQAWSWGVPVLGTPLRLLTWPALLAAFTYRLGKSYVDHYEAGGQPHDFKPEGILSAPLAPAPA